MIAKVLWHTRVDRPGEEGGQGGSLLSAGERDRAAHFRREVDRIVSGILEGDSGGAAEEVG